MSNNTTPQLDTIHIVGAGLAGSECAFQLAEAGHKVVLYEMRPKEQTPAHKTGGYAELVCSNSFGSTTDYSAPGQLKWEAEKLNSLILKAAQKAQVPAGMALAVDRLIFSDDITKTLTEHPNIQISQQVVTDLSQIPRPCVIATGPLTHMKLAESIRQHFDNEFLYFYDAIAPIIDADSINMDVAWFADRFDKGTNDYLNCPLNKEQYETLMHEILGARKIESKDFEKEFENTPYFDGCMPIEVIVERGFESPRFGPMSPKGLKHHGPKDLYAVVQLRKENKEGTAYNMVGFQTKMAYPEQARVFRMIPGLEEAEFLKLGSIHRNMYIHSPKKLTPFLSSPKDPGLFFAGQITGVEGYFDSTCIGLLVAKFVSNHSQNKAMPLPPRETAIGSLLNAITDAEREHFQPTNINFSLFPTPQEPGLRGRSNKRKKRERMIEVAQTALTQWMNEDLK